MTAWTAKAVARGVVGLNSLVDGAMVNISLVPAWHRENWIVTVHKSMYGEPSEIIGRGSTADAALKDARDWVRRRLAKDGLVHLPKEFFDPVPTKPATRQEQA